MENDGYSEGRDPNQFLKSMGTKWLDLMEADNTPPADRKEIAQLLANWYQKFYLAQWETQQKK